MHEELVAAVAMAYQGDVEGSRVAIHALAPADHLAWALWSFAAADYDGFSEHVAAAAFETDADRRAVRSALRTLLQVEHNGRVVIPVGETRVAGDSPVSGLIGYLLSESAYSAGLLERSDLITRRVLDRTSSDDPFLPWVRISRIRVLAFLGLSSEAASEVEVLKSEIAEWPLGAALVGSHEALVASIRADTRAVEAAARRTRVGLPRPTHQLDAMAVALTGLALSTVGRPKPALEALLVGGDDLALLPMVSRCHVGDLAIDLCLQLGLVEDAQRHLDRSESFDVEAGSFCAAAVERSRARLLAISNVEAPDAGPHAEMYLTSERAFADLAALPKGAADIADLTRRVAGAGLSEVRAWARREAGDESVTEQPFAGLGWDALSAQARVVARLAASGMRNKEIAAAIFLSEKTVEGLVATVLATLGTKSRVSIGDRVPFDVPVAAIRELTKRQGQVARLLAEGRGNAEIADALVISEKTVEKHVSDLFSVLGVNSRAAVAAFVRAL